MNKRYKFSMNRMYVSWLLLVMLVVSSCATTVAFTPSTVVPAAEGKVKVKKDNNDNHAIQINVRHLAEPDRLPIPQSTYVVWMESSNGLKNIGQFKSGSGLLSSTRKGELETVSPFRPTRVFITAESSPDVQHPGNIVVLSTRSF